MPELSTATFVFSGDNDLSLHACAERGSRWTSNQRPYLIARERGQNLNTIFDRYSDLEVAVLRWSTIAQEVRRTAGYRRPWLDIDVSRVLPHLCFLIAILGFTAGLCAEDQPQAKFAEMMHGRWMSVMATAYCPCAICCGARAAGLTSTGVRVDTDPYGIAAHPRYLDPGALVFIPSGQGYLDRSQPTERFFAVDDTGGIVRRRSEQSDDLWIDLRYRFHQSAVEFGVRRLRIFVFDVPAKVTP